MTIKPFSPFPVAPPRVAYRIYSPSPQPRFQPAPAPAPKPTPAPSQPAAPPLNRFGAWPMKWQGPSLNGKGNEVAMESMELAHEGLDIDR